MCDSLNILKKTPFFQGIPEAELSLVAQILVERSYRKHMLLFMEGEKGEAVHFVLEGKVKIYKTSEDGREHILDIAVPGDVFAEVVLFQEVPYPATAEVIEDGRIAFIRSIDLERLLFEHPALAVGVIRMLNRRLMAAQAQIKSLALQDTHSRTAEILLRLASEHGIHTPQGIQLDLALSRQELANLVGTTRETVTRVLTSFKKAKILEMDRSVIRITNLEKLKDWMA